MPSYRLDGREYVIITSSTIKHDLYVRKLLREADLATIHIPPGADTDQVIRDLIDRTVDSGHAVALLAALLLPAHLQVREWTPAIADEIATHIEQIVEPAEKEQVWPLLASALVGFFQRGLVSLTTSRISSIPNPLEDDRDEPGENDQTDGSVTMANGTASFARSPSGT